MDKAFVMVIIGLYALGAISFLCLILSELFGEKNELKFLDEGSKRQVKNDVVNKKGVENTNGRDNFEYYDVWEDFDDSKSKLEIGFEYEMYVGHLYEKRGFSVFYNGILMGSRDRGIDLVCIRGRIVHLVQCKRWSNLKHKTIDEQLIHKFACSASDFDVNVGFEVVPVFYSTVPFDFKAMRAANMLGIVCCCDPKHELELREWLESTGVPVASFKRRLNRR